jgi:pilus assembly protein Flp/PilA
MIRLNRHSHAGRDKKSVRDLFVNRDGVTAIEYGLIASLIAAALVVGLATAGPTLAGIFETISERLQQVIAEL